MNANPFTLGHRHLVEQAAMQCDALHLFVVREDASFFPFSARLGMVRAGRRASAKCDRARRLAVSSPAPPSRPTFERDRQVQQAWSEIDVLIFRDFIAPALGITHRFIGSEPFCDITRQYNQTLHALLSRRLRWWKCRASKATGNAISASEVRRLLKTQQFSRIREIAGQTPPSRTSKHYRAVPKSAQLRGIYHENCKGGAGRNAGVQRPDGENCSRSRRAGDSHPQ